MYYTHYGWFGFCPVYIADPWGRCPNVTYRHPILKPLLDLNIRLQQTAIFLCSMVNPEWEPAWKIRLTGKLSNPVRC